MTGTARWTRIARLLVLAPLVAAGCSRGGDTRASDTSVGAAPATDSVPLGDLTGEEVTEADTGAGAYDPRSAAAIGFWRLAGNEPFWGVSVDTGGIVFRTPENQDGIRFPISVPVAAGDSLRFNSVTPDTPGHEIEIVLHKGRCPDSMSDKLWDYSARVTVDRRSYTGCGERGDVPFVLGRRAGGGT